MALPAALRLPARAVRQAARAAVTLVYPPVCIACGSATGEPHTLCGRCWSGIRFIERPFCERLGTPFAVDLGPGLVSPAAIADPPVYRRARAAARYDDAARLLVQRLKYSDRLDLACALGRMMARAGAELLAEADVVVPVPLHRIRLWRRRFNQAMELARVVAAAGPVPCEPALLARVKATRPQVGLTRHQRGLNLQGAFRVPEAARPRLAGRRVLLVDDVLTTGATANAAGRRSCGAAPNRSTSWPSRVSSRRHDGTISGASRRRGQAGPETARDVPSGVATTRCRRPGGRAICAAQVPLRGGLIPGVSGWRDAPSTKAIGRPTPSPS